MRFMMLMIPKGYESAAPGTMPPADAVAAMMKYNEALKAAGVLITLDGLHPPSMGARVSFAGGKPLVTDGPFTEAKEVLGGYWMIDVASREEAIAWAKKCPAGPNEVIEIRQVQEMADFPEDVQQAAAGFAELQSKSGVSREEGFSDGAGAQITIPPPVGRNIIARNAAPKSAVARVERSETRDPDCAPLHPGYRFAPASCKSCSHELAQGTRRAARGYHHGNLKEALLQAALGLIAEKGPAGFTFADAARSAGVSPAAPYRHFRDRDELLSSIAQRGFEQFEAVLSAAWDDGRPETLAAFERVGKAYLKFAREEPAFYSAMFESGLPVDLNPSLQAAGERAFGVIRAAAERLAALSPPGVTRPPALMMALHIWSMSHGVASLFAPRRCGAAQAADVGRGSAGSRSLDLSARARLSDRAAQTGRSEPPAARSSSRSLGQSLNIM